MESKSRKKWMVQQKVKVSDYGVWVLQKISGRFRGMSGMLFLVVFIFCQIVFEKDEVGSVNVKEYVLLQYLDRLKIKLNQSFYYDYLIKLD